METVPDDSLLQWLGLPGLVNNHFHEEDLGPIPQCRNQVLKNLDRETLGPVVKDVAEQIDVRLDRLLREEVVLHEPDPLAKLGRHVRCAVRCRVGEVLNDKLQGGKRSGQGDADVPSRATNLGVRCSSESVSHAAPPQEGRLTSTTVASPAAFQS